MTAAVRFPEVEAQVNRAHHLPENYQRRWETAYYLDEPTGVQWQGDVYQRAAALIKAEGWSRVVDLGCGNGDKLCHLRAQYPFLEIIGVDHGENLELARRQHAACPTESQRILWVPVDLEVESHLPIGKLDRSLVILADVLEHMQSPMMPIRAATSRGARRFVISTPDRARLYDEGHLGPPANQAHVMEWTYTEFGDFLVDAFRPYTVEMEVTHVRPSDQDDRKTTICVTARLS